MMPLIKIRCSQLGRLMARTKNGEPLSVGAKTLVKELAKQHVYGFFPSQGEAPAKEMNKGIIVEPEAIKLLNEVTFSDYKKNEIRLEDDLIGGTTDIDTGDENIDIKASWSLKTFPATPADGENSDYEWQLRGYMRLWNRSKARLVYCLVDTPGELCQYEDQAIHSVSHIAPELRVTQIRFERTDESERQIEFKVKAAQDYFGYAVEDILKSHN